MTRENLARALHWDKAKWVLASCNAVFLVPQLLTILGTRETGVVSLTTLVWLLCIQFGFGFHGFVIRDLPVFTTNLIGGAVTFTTVSAVVFFRHFN